MNILELPDEVLVLVFQYLSGSDKLMIYNTCNRFKHIVEAKKLCRELDFSGNYSVTISSMKSYLKPTKLKKCVRMLDITSCYWFPPAEIRNLVVKMSSLTSLHIADTNVSVEQMVQMLKALPELKRLSFTWYSDVPECIGYKDISSVSERLKNLEYLSVYIKTNRLLNHDFSLLYKWLSYCSKLQELRIIAPEQSQNVPFCIDFLVRNVRYELGHSFPELHTLVLSLRDRPFDVGGVDRLFQLVLDAVLKNTSSSWKCFWTTSRRLKWGVTTISDTVSAYECTTLMMNNTVEVDTKKTFPNLEHLNILANNFRFTILDLERLAVKKLFWRVDRVMDWNELLYFSDHLKELNIASCLKEIKNVNLQEKISKLALPTCILKGVRSHSGTVCPEANGAIKIVVESFPNVTEFEFIPCRECKFEPVGYAHEPTIAAMGDWKQLRRLKFIGLNFIRTGKPISYIFSSCEKLEQVSIKNLGQHGSCSYLFELNRGLEHCKNLTEFRFEQANVVSLDTLLEALKMCQKLERVCIISDCSTKPPQDNNVIEMTRVLKKLIFLYMYIEKWPLHIPNKLTRVLKEELVPIRPALHLTLLGATAKKTFSEVKSIPAVHFFDMILDVSRICTLPADGK